jgi:hypothetical protein
VRAHKMRIRDIESFDGAETRREDLDVWESPTLSLSPSTRNGKFWRISSFFFRRRRALVEVLFDHTGKEEWYR